MEARREAPADRRPVLGIVSLVAGVLSLALLLASLQPPPATPAAQLAFVASHRGAYVAFTTIVLTWAVLSIPFVVTLRTLLENTPSVLGTSALLLCAIGILLLGFALFMHAGALLAIASAGTPARPEDALYQVAIWSNLRYFLTDPGLMTWGLGQFLFGWAARKGDVLPRWLAVLGMIGGVAGLLTLAVYQTGVLALVQIVVFTTWGFTTGVVLLRGRRGPVAATASGEFP